LIGRFNGEIRHICRDECVTYTEVWNIERIFHTAHGLHMNRRGKKKLSSIIVKQILRNERLSLDSSHKIDVITDDGISNAQTQNDNVCGLLSDAGTQDLNSQGVNSTLNLV
jgi:hypothetical protein